MVSLNAPLGVAIAPAGFGIYSGDLLVGNFGDGLITAYNPTTYAYLGTLADGTGKALSYPGLWDIFSNASGNASALYFTAGLLHETHGPFRLDRQRNDCNQHAPTFNLSDLVNRYVGCGWLVFHGHAQHRAEQLLHRDGFVELQRPARRVGLATSEARSLRSRPTHPRQRLLTLATQGTNGRLESPRLGRHRDLGIVAALLLPFGSLLLGRRRREFAGLRVVAMLAGLFVSAGLISGCSSSTGTTPTPTGTSNVTLSPQRRAVLARRRRSP